MGVDGNFEHVKQENVKNDKNVSENEMKFLRWGSCKPHCGIKFYFSAVKY